MNFFQNIKHIFFIVAICLIILLGTYQLFLTNFMAPINYFFIYRTGTNESIFQDAIYKPKLEASRNIVVIEIDDESINSLGWNEEAMMLTIEKNVYIELLDVLKKAGAKAVWFDIVFQNPDPKEKEFANALVNFGNAVIAVTEPKSQFRTVGDFWKDDCTDIKNSGKWEDLICPFTPRAVYGKVKWGSISSNNYRSKTIENVSAWYLLRNYVMQYFLKYQTESIPAGEWSPIYNLWLSLALFDGNIHAEKVVKNTELGNKKSPKNTLMQPYFSRENITKKDGLKPYIHISLIQLVSYLKKTGAEREEEKAQIIQSFSEILNNSYVLVGESGEFLHDTFISPVTNESLPWVYSHAMMLDGVLQDKMLEKLDDTITYISAILLTIIAVILYFFLPKFLSPIFVLWALLLTIFLARYSYAEWRILVDILPFLLGAGLVTYPITYIYKFFIVEKDKRHIVQAFSRYLSPSVVEMIDSNKVTVSLGGEKKELSIFFSDIAGFTSISEKMDTKDLFIVMTKYLSDMTDILISEKWTLDKYIGDGVMGFFGAPVDDPLHAINACNTALRMRSALKDFNAWLANSGHDAIDFRVGIATGEVMVGNIGSEKQFNYTVLGDTVNLASRLEGTGKEYGVNIIIAESTRKAIGNMFLVRELDYIAVKWKETGVRIFELLGKKDDNIDMTPYTTYESALSLYRAGNYQDAGHVFESLAETDNPSNIMMHRCVSLIKGEMTLKNGVYKMTHK